MKNKYFYIKTAVPAPFQKGDVIKMDFKGEEFLIVKMDCKNNFFRKLFRKNSIEGCIKLKPLKTKPGFIKRFIIKWKIFNWKFFVGESIRCYEKTGDIAYMKIRRMANIKIIRLRKQLK